MKKVVKNKSNSYLQMEGSKFYCYGFKISSVNQVDDIIKNLWKENKKAVHICYGLVLEQNNQVIERFDDDNEPKSSAGKKILLCLLNNDFVNTLLVVVRYKTKSLLGLGLLSRCYYNVCELLVKDENNFTEYKKTSIYKIDIKNPKQLSSLLNYIKANKIDMVSNHDNQITLEIDDENKKVIEKMFNEK